MNGCPIEDSRFVVPCGRMGCGPTIRGKNSDEGNTARSKWTNRMQDRGGGKGCCSLRRKRNLHSGAAQRSATGRTSRQGRISGEGRFFTTFFSIH